MQDLLRQHLFGAVDLRFHRFGRSAAQSCSFGHGVLLQQHQTAGRAVGLTQVQDHSGKFFLAQRIQHLLLRLHTGRRALQRQHLVAGGVHLAHPCAAQIIFGFVGGDARQPLLFKAGRAAVDGPPRRQKSLLRQVLRFLYIRHQLVADRVHERLIFLHHRAEFLCCQRAARPPFRFWMRCSAPPFCL